MLSEIRDEILRFLSSKGPSVLCVSGAWGVGKTHAWNKYLREAKLPGDGKYAYVSLFGIGSLEELRYAVFENTIPISRLEDGPSEATLSHNLKSLWPTRAILKPGVGLATSFFRMGGMSEIFSKSAFITVRDQIICLDDLERASKGLDIRDVLGLVSQLKNERRCKVVIILNDGEHDSKVELRRHFEKVIDVNLPFDLKPSEILEIALPSEDEVTAKISPLISSLNISNIRVIKRIELAAQSLVDDLSSVSAHIIDRSLATLVLGMWAAHKPEIEDLFKLIRGYSRTSRLVATTRNPSKGEDALAAILPQYPYAGASELDLLILDRAERGYVNRAEIKSTAQKINDAQPNRSEFGQTWEFYFNAGIGEDHSHFMTKLYKSAMDEVALISPAEINTTIRILRQFQHTSHADDLCREYAAKSPYRGVRYVSRDTMEADGITDPLLRDELRRASVRIASERDIVEVLRSFATGSGDSEADIITLNSTPVDALVKAFSALDGKQARAAVERVVLLEKLSQGDVEKLNANARMALQYIANLSLLQAHRLRQMGFNGIPGQPAIS